MSSQMKNVRKSDKTEDKSAKENKKVLNVHQLRVLERIEQKKLEQNLKKAKKSDLEKRRCKGNKKNTEELNKVDASSKATTRSSKRGGRTVAEIATQLKIITSSLKYTEKRSPIKHVEKRILPKYAEKRSPPKYTEKRSPTKHVEKSSLKGNEKISTNLKNPTASTSKGSLAKVHYNKKQDAKEEKCKATARLSRLRNRLLESDEDGMLDNSLSQSSACSNSHSALIPSKRVKRYIIPKKLRNDKETAEKGHQDNDAQISVNPLQDVLSVGRMQVHLDKPELSTSETAKISIPSTGSNDAVSREVDKFSIMGHNSLPESYDNKIAKNASLKRNVESIDNHTLSKKNNEDMPSLKRKREDEPRKGEVDNSVQSSQPSYRSGSLSNIKNMTCDLIRRQRKKHNFAERRLLMFRHSLSPIKPEDNSLLNNNDPNKMTIDVDMERNLDTSYGANIFLSKTVNSNKDDSMDWQTAEGELNEIRNFLSSESGHDQNLVQMISQSDETAVIVVDTNILIKFIDTIRSLVNDQNSHLKLVIPWVVFNELDKLKSSIVQCSARKAIKFIHSNLINKNILGQSLLSANNHLYHCDSADDEILNCCLQMIKDTKVFLLTDDINLCNKALVNNVKVFTHEEFIANAGKELKIKFVYKSDERNMFKSTRRQIEPLDSTEFSKHYRDLENIFIDNISIILKTEMRNVFGDYWLIHVRKPPWDAIDLVKSLDKNWQTVFQNLLPQDFHLLLLELLKKLEVIDMFSMHHNDLKDIYFCCRDIFTCLLPTTYKHVAVEALSKIHQNQYVHNNMNMSWYMSIINENFDIFNQIKISSMVLCDAFFQIYSKLGIFCANLANILEVPHDVTFIIEEPLSLNELVIQADSVSNQLNILRSSLENLLAVQDLTLTTDPMLLNSTVQNFSLILFDTLQGIKISTISLTLNDIKIVFLLRRQVFEEGEASIVKLNNLMLQCSEKYASLQKFR